ncbi:MAG: cytidylate kinase [Novosphingobium sp.]|nr:cytidylate kinase [Novosphingobium sp.]
MIIAVDGPTASGKGTIARALAAHFGLPHLDTGLLYRAVGRQCLLDGGDPDDPVAALAATSFPDALLTDPELRSEETGGLASRVSIHPAVRRALFDRQRAFATQPGGAVLDGRDIGTVIAPEAGVKLYVTASIPARARRRYLEMLNAGRQADRDAIAGDLLARDMRDTGRKDAPLRAADDAVTIDTSDMTVEQAVTAALAVVEQHRQRKDQS